MELERPSLEHKDDYEQFKTAIERRVNEKSYPTCDPSLAQDILLALFVAEEASNRGLQSYSQELRDIALAPLEAGRTILERVQNDEALSAQDDRTPELQSWLLSTRLWRKTITSFQQVDDDIERVGDIANTVVTANNYEDARDGLERFRTQLENDIQQIGTSEDPLADARLRTPEASANRVVVYNGLLMLLHRREMGAEFSEIELGGS